MARLTLLAILTAAIIATPPAPGASAQSAELPVIDAAETSPDLWLWVARPLVVFADSPADPRFVQQMQMITAGADALADRDVVVIFDTDPSAQSAWRQQLRPRGFMLTLIGKDGTVALRRPVPRDARELSAQIDKMPTRQQELRDRGTRIR
jgi:hypothetical protein